MRKLKFVKRLYLRKYTLFLEVYINLFPTTVLECSNNIIFWCIKFLYVTNFYASKPSEMIHPYDNPLTPLDIAILARCLILSENV